ncbi:unnamed protein product [Adineta ricciae]|uniref:Uncharacterized protein n=1 Tax=Adineta ricciae TaxID=249248 RepID=A0A814XH60_ADIRI|nr:unnamed protein product [Adineta ricciae]CAF1398965.1 unnamed protein product [Adineta ricciae]
MSGKRQLPRSNNPARKRPVPWYSGDFMEAVFPMSGSDDRIYLVWTGTDRNISKPVAGYGYRFSPSDSWHFTGGFRSEMASFLRDFVGNSWNPALGIIVLGITVLSVNDISLKYYKKDVA